MTDPTTLGQRIRHFRTTAGPARSTSSASRSGWPAASSRSSRTASASRGSRSSRRWRRRLGVQLADLLDDAPPTAARRARDRARARPARAPLRVLGLPAVRAEAAGSTDETLESIVGLHRELQRRAREAVATPGAGAARQHRAAPPDADRSTTRCPSSTRSPRSWCVDVGHERAPSPTARCRSWRQRIGFELVHVRRSPALGALGDRLRERPHLPAAGVDPRWPRPARAWRCRRWPTVSSATRCPETYDEFLRQRLEINYFASAVLMPKTAAVNFLRQAKADRNIAVEDFRDAFGVTARAAALRFTNLATEHLDITLHFLRVDDDGAVAKAYENDGLRLPVDATGSTEGQFVCRKWSARTAFGRQQPHDRVLPVHRHSRGHLLRLDPDRHHRERGVLHHDRRAVRASPSGSAAGRPRTGACSTCPDEGVLQASRTGAAGALGREGVVQREAARAHPVAAFRPAPSPVSTTANSTSSSRAHAATDARLCADSAPACRYIPAHACRIGTESGDGALVSSQHGRWNEGDRWVLKTPPGSSEYTMHREGATRSSARSARRSWPIRRVRSRMLSPGCRPEAIGCHWAPPTSRSRPPTARTWAWARSGDQPRRRLVRHPQGLPRAASACTCRRRSEALGLAELARRTRNTIRAG